MAHIDIDSAPIEEETAIAGRFIPIPVMAVDQPIAIIFEEPIPKDREDLLGLDGRLNQASIFGFQACDAPCHG